jgi:hypothetical protein
MVKLIIFQLLSRFDLRWALCALVDPLLAMDDAGQRLELKNASKKRRFSGNRSAHVFDCFSVYIYTHYMCVYVTCIFRYNSIMLISFKILW